MPPADLRHMPGPSSSSALMPPLLVQSPADSSSSSSSAAPAYPFPIEMDQADGNHSSEEELEEIYKAESTVGAANNASGGKVSTASHPSLSSSSASAASSSSASSSLAPSRARPSSALSDLDLNAETPTPNGAGNMHYSRSSSCGGGGATDTDQSMAVSWSSGGGGVHPVQFSTSPPTGLHVYKPSRRSSSPPHHNGAGANGAPAGTAAAGDDGQEEVVDGAAGGLHPDDYGAAGGGGGGGSGRRSSDRSRRTTISPRKRYSRQSRTQPLPQRPCLDFEKMQQVRTYPKNLRVQIIVFKLRIFSAKGEGSDELATRWRALPVLLVNSAPGEGTRTEERCILFA